MKYILSHRRVVSRKIQKKNGKYLIPVSPALIRLYSLKSIPYVSII